MKSNNSNLRIDLIMLEIKSRMNIIRDFIGVIKTRHLFKDVKKQHKNGRRSFNENHYNKLIKYIYYAGSSTRRVVIRERENELNLRNKKMYDEIMKVVNTYSKDLKSMESNLDRKIKVKRELQDKLLSRVRYK